MGRQDSALNGSKWPLHWFSCDLLVLFPNIWTSWHFQRTYCIHWCYVLSYMLLMNMNIHSVSSAFLGQFP